MRSSPAWQVCWLSIRSQRPIEAQAAIADIFWLRDASAADPESLLPPAEIVAENVDSLELAQEKFRLVAVKLRAA